MSSLARHEGWIEIDHSASPGIPLDIALKMGYNQNQAAHLAEGKVMRGATLSCDHCGNNWIKNPVRIRPRAYCKQCDHYICDGCDHERSLPNYVHRNKRDKLDAILSSAQRGELFDPSSPKPLSIIVP